MRLRRLIIAILLLTSPPGALAVVPERLALIVRADRDVVLRLDEVAQIYLRKRRFWPDRSPIVPVNRDSGSPIREAFNRRIFPNTERSLQVYWNQQYFKGVLPPVTLASDEAVKRFVAVDENAIGYIRANAVDESVRVLLYLDLEPPAASR